MNFIKDLFYKLLKLIDDGRFLVKPMKWWYYVKGVIPFAFPLLFIYLMIEEEMYRNFSGWGKFLFWVFAFLFTLYLVIVAYVSFLFWSHRAKRIDQVVRRGDNYTAIPLLADNIKNTGEIFGILISVIFIVGAVFFYIFLLLSGEEGVYEDLNFIKMLPAIVILAVICVLTTYFIIFITHFIAEKLRLLAQIGNDLRDVADIHRAVAMSGEEEQKLEVRQESTVME